VSVKALYKIPPAPLFQRGKVALSKRGEGMSDFNNDQGGILL
jgi:hypothetical protein